MTYGNHLKEKREERNLTQTELAKATHISQQNISRWERNEILPNIHFCTILADFYGISIDELVGHEIKKNW